VDGLNGWLILGLLAVVVGALVLGLHRLGQRARLKRMVVKAR